MPRYNNEFALGNYRANPSGQLPRRLAMRGTPGDAGRRRTGMQDLCTQEMEELFKLGWKYENCNDSFTLLDKMTA